MAESSVNLKVLEKQIMDYKEMENDKLKEISELKKVNNEWEQKTKEILYEIQQNDLMLAKKEFERNLQVNQLYAMISSQEEQIDTLNKQLQHQARKEQAALVHAKLNMNRSMIGNSFVGVSAGQSFVVPQSSEPMITPSKVMQRVNSSDKLTE